MASDQKIENLLNLALDAAPAEREKSMTLDVGYDGTDRKWDLILRYQGGLEELSEQKIPYTKLTGGYAVAAATQAEIEMLAGLPQILYIEKPKRLFFSAARGRTASCMDVLQLTDRVPGTVETPLLGQGVLIAVIDSGVDYTHPDFCNPDGSSRILAIWDQSVPGNPPEGFSLGTEYTKNEIDEALRTGERLPTRDVSGHGTEVLGIAAGNGRASLLENADTAEVSGGIQARFGPRRGVAPLAYILAVKLGSPRADSFPRTTELMLAIEYVYQKAREWNLPMSVNLSFGNVYGPHNGTGLLETYLSLMAGVGRSVICVGNGNEGNTAGHASGRFQPAANESTQEIELGVAAYERTLNLQIWKSYADEAEISLIHPNGQILGPFPGRLGAQRYFAGETELLVFYGEPSPYSVSQEIYVDFLPVNEYVDSGVWKIWLAPGKIVNGRFDLWLPEAQTLNAGTRFYFPDVENTLTIPATARNIIAVGAYDAANDRYAPFSGRGNPPGEPLPAGAALVKPDIAAPGVNITTTAPGGGYTAVSGTSFSTPFVAGAAAMLMQWGVVDGNDPYLYGEKVRACLQRGARSLPGMDAELNTKTGYGALCVRDSLPR